MALIDKQAAIDAAIKADMENHNGILSEKRARVFEEHISILSPVQLKRKTGYKINQHQYPAKWVCSECGAKHFDFSDNFCSQCGADVRGEVK